jgi:hypothetical protein
MMQTIKVIHATEDEPLSMSLFKMALFALGVGVIGLLIVTGVVNISGEYSSYSAACRAVADNPVDGPILDWLRDLWSLAWLGIRILFWFVVAVLGTFVVLGVMASVGVLTWIAQRVAGGIAYMVGLVKAAWTKADATIAVKPGVDIKAILKDLDDRVERLEANMPLNESAKEQVSNG